MIIDDLTVFIISTGEDTYQECLEALHNQDCEFNIMHVRDVYPMSRAFQTMPDICPTKYFVQVDADMVLHPNAITKLYSKIRRTGFWVYQVHGQLYEEGYGIRGAVKCWKKDIFKYFEFHDVRTVDRDFNRRVERWGLRKQALHTDPIGWHKPRHSTFSLYLKSKSDVEKWRFLGRKVEQYALDVLDTALANLPASQFQLLGALLGSMTGMHRVVRSKDILHERHLFNEVKNFLGKTDELEVFKNEFKMKTDRLRSLFSQCYDFEGGNLAPFILDLSREIFEIYSAIDFSEETIIEFSNAVRK